MPSTVLAVQIIRAFSYFSHLANLAEDQHHIRRIRAHAMAKSPPREGTMAHALARAKHAGVTLAHIHVLAIKSILGSFAGFKRAETDPDDPRKLSAHELARARGARQRRRRLPQRRSGPNRRLVAEGGSRRLTHRGR
jgi:Phosphoenolpyruvate carboxylase